ncbi:MAG: LysR family transcriptional regulator, partial [Sutterella wadsworthensis]
MSKTDDLSAWRVFVTVARSGTLSAAAKALDVEVSSISRAIGGLEKALGCELIRRNMRPMKLTEAGQAALKRMETILRAHDGLMEALVNDNRALTGRVRLSSAPGFATRKLVPFIREFTEAHPGISVDIQ